MNKISLVCLLCFVAFSCVSAFEKARLEDIEEVHLFKDRITLGYKPVAQQKCIGPSKELCEAYPMDEIKCNKIIRNVVEEKWVCDGNLVPGIKFDQQDVTCETYPGTLPIQGIIIRGSCGLRYSLREDV